MLYSNQTSVARNEFVQKVKWMFLGDTRYLTHFMYLIFKMKKLIQIILLKERPNFDFLTLSRKYSQVSLRFYFNVNSMLL